MPDFSVTRVGEIDATASPTITSTERFARAFAVYCADVFLEHRKQGRAGLDEDDAGLALGYVRIVLGEVGAVELGERPRALDPGRTAAHDDDVERAVVHELGIPVGRLPALQDVVP